MKKTKTVRKKRSVKKTKTVRRGRKPGRKSAPKQQTYHVAIQVDGFIGLRLKAESVGEAFAMAKDICDDAFVHSDGIFADDMNKYGLTVDHTDANAQIVHLSECDGEDE
jgi:hypothetical protein